jgi:hypothetical protein
MSCQAVEDVITEALYVSPSGVVVAPTGELRRWSSEDGSWTQVSRMYRRLAPGTVTNSAGCPSYVMRGVLLLLGGSEASWMAIPGRLGPCILGPCILSEVAQNTTDATENIRLKRSPDGGQTAPVHPNGIYRHYHDLPDGRVVSLFVNDTTGLIVVDLVDADERGGVEICRYKAL